MLRRLVSSYSQKGKTIMKLEDDLQPPHLQAFAGGAS